MNSNPSTRAQDGALLMLRLVIASIFLYAGYAKWPFWSSAPEGLSGFLLLITKFLSVAEPLAALALAAGFFTRLAALCLAVVMAGAIYVMQVTYHIGFVNPASPGWNFPLALLACCLVLAAFGAGRWSVDARRKRPAG